MSPQPSTTETTVEPFISVSQEDDGNYGHVSIHNGKNGGVRIHNLSQGAHDFLQQIQVPKNSNINFFIDGIPFQAHYRPEGDMIHLSIWATLGYLPYSAASAQKRGMLINILNGIRSLPTVKFGVDKHQQIMVKADYTIPNIELPTFIFMPLIQFLQESRAFIQLIGEVI